MNRSALSPIERRVAQHIENCFPGIPSPIFIIGVSGGPDSMALLHLIKELNHKGIVVHINYQKRGPSSDKDQELVEKTAKEWGYDFKSIKLDPKNSKGENFQQWARGQRYLIFEKIREENEADAVVTAHHQNDQIETILQKLFRGAGLAAWGGMNVWDEPLFRPLLDTAQQQIMTYIEQNSIPYRTDESNLRSDFARNLLRNEWLEKLEDFFPGWQKNILRLPEQAVLFSESLDYIRSNITDNHDRIDIAAFTSLSLALQKALILHLMKRQDLSLEVTTGALDQIENIPALQTGQSIQLTKKYSLMRDREWLKIICETSPELQFVELQRDRLEKAPFTLDGLTYRLVPFWDHDFEHALYLDCKKFAWPLVLRSWRAGDQFQPFGMSGHQKVSDHLTDRKISAVEKEKALVLESFEEKICAVIFPPIEKINPPGTISDLVQCDERTSRCLVIEPNR